MTVTIDAIDLSNWNKQSMDFAAAAKAGVKIVWHKATEGSGFTDSWYRIRRGQVAGHAAFGAYHFARPGDPVQQARFFLNAASIKPGDARPMLDLEDPTMGGWSVRKRTRWVRRWVAEVQAVTNVPPVIYTRFPLNDNFDCPLWVARYSNPMWAPMVPKPWKAWSIWQYTNGVFGSPNTVPGVGHCDINTFNKGVTADMLTLQPEKKLAPVPVQAARRIRSIHALRPGVQRLLKRAAAWARRNG